MSSASAALASNSGRWVMPGRASADAIRAMHAMAGAKVRSRTAEASTPKPTRQPTPPPTVPSPRTVARRVARQNQTGPGTGQRPHQRRPDQRSQPRRPSPQMPYNEVARPDGDEPWTDILDRLYAYYTGGELQRKRTAEEEAELQALIAEQREEEYLDRWGGLVPLRATPNEFGFASPADYGWLTVAQKDRSWQIDDDPDGEPWERVQYYPTSDARRGRSRRVYVAA